MSAPPFEDFLYVTIAMRFLLRETHAILGYNAAR